MPRFFNVTQARDLLPRVKDLIEQAVDGKAQYQVCEQWTQNFTRRVMMLGGVLVDREPFERNRDLMGRSGERLKAAVEEIHGHGVLIKDLDNGLIDFPTLFNGSEVYLCYRMGEDDLRFWHGVNEGFAGRKEIDEEFLSGHRGRSAD